jgi:hypothetical protein
MPIHAQYDHRTDAKRVTLSAMAILASFQKRYGMPAAF